MSRLEQAIEQIEKQMLKKDLTFEEFDELVRRVKKLYKLRDRKQQ